jgi:uncharacterized membrane protein
MVESHIEPESGTGYLILRPNQSLSWRGTQLVLAAAAAALGGVALAFGLAGFWPIAPFAGLELLALTTALYLSQLRQQQREVISFTDDEVMVQRGRIRPDAEVRFPRPWSRFVILPGGTRFAPRRVILRCHNRQVELARSLNESDKDLLISHLRDATRTYPGPRDNTSAPPC